MKLKESSKIKTRAKIVFGTGDTLQAITMTSNLGFYRAASQQVCNFIELIIIWPPEIKLKVKILVVLNFDLYSRIYFFHKVK